MATDVLNRRKLLKTSAGLSLGLIATVTLPGCSKTATCFNPDNYGVGETLAREGRAYAEPSPMSDKNCANCSLFKKESGACGICTIDDLPAAETGYCTSWSA